MSPPPVQGVPIGPASCATGVPLSPPPASWAYALPPHVCLGAPPNAQPSASPLERAGSGGAASFAAAAAAMAAAAAAAAAAEEAAAEAPLCTLMRSLWHLAQSAAAAAAAPGSDAARAPHLARWRGEAEVELVNVAGLDQQVWADP